jgi:hypothetical protein
LWSVQAANAQTDNWIGGNSDWNTATNWDSGVVPGSGDTVNVVNTDGTSPTITYDYVGPVFSLQSLRVSALDGTESFLMSTAGLTISASGVDLGYSGNGSTLSGVGVLTQSAGVNSSGQILMGVGSLDYGSYVLNGNGTVTTGELYVGFGGSGDFEQSDGENTVSVLHLAWLAGSTGSYNLSSSGSMTATAREEIGVRGPGSFVQSGGVNVVGTGSSNQLLFGYLYLGRGTGSSGTYRLSSGSLIANSYEEVGYGGTGILSQSGGTNTITTALQVAYNSGSTGSYALSGTSSVLTPLEYIGYSGSGSFNQSGGTNNIRSVTFTQFFKSDFLYLGYNVGSTGTYELSGTGTLSAGYYLNRAAPMEGGGEYVGFSGTGIFNQSGGTNFINANLGTVLCVACNTGSNGIYILSGTGSLTVQGNEIVGYSGSGLFDQSGGVNINFGVELGANPGSTGTYEQSGGINYLPSSTLYLGANSGSTGAYTLTGAGSLSVGRAEYVGNSGAGVFNQSGGTNTINGSLYLGYNEDASGSYTLSGNGSLISKTEVVGNNGGNFYQTGGTNSVGQLYVDGRGSTAAYTLCGTGTLAGTTEIVGNQLAGTFLQLGGTNIVSGDLDLGLHPNSNGNYTLGGGRLVVNNLSVGGGSVPGGTGVFGLTGSSASLSSVGNITVYDTLGRGFNISAGTVIAASLNLAGGSFTQSGGTAIFSNLTGSGTDTITGGITTLALGGTPSQLGTLNISDPGTLDLQLGGYTQGVTYDLLNITGSSSLGGTLELDLVNGFVPQIGDQFTVMTAANGFTGEFDNYTSNDGLFTYAIDYGANNNVVEITVTSVPEPTALGVLILSGLTLHRTRRRKSKH